MNTEMFAATIRPYNMVGRERELAQLRQGIFAPGRENRYFFIRGQGGLGKTRLLEEVLCGLRHPEVSDWADPWPCPDWRKTDNQDVLLLGIIDLIDIRLHASNHFINALFEKFQAQGAIFENYLLAWRDYEYLVQQGTAYQVAQKAAREAEATFWHDYQKVAETHRIVWLVDTAEQLNEVTSRWLLEQEVPGKPGEKLLRVEDMQEQTQVWLANQIRAGNIANSTLIFSGRGEEGKAFFETIETAVQEADEKLQTIFLDPFDSWQMAKAYFDQLAEDWKKRAEQPSEGLRTRHLAENMQALARDEEMVQVLWLYTRGQPVLLSLFADLVLEEAIDMPSVLNVSNQQALKKVATASLDHTTPELIWQQWQIETLFITLLFTPVPEKEGTLYRNILLCLVRSPRGLSIEQLHYLLDAESRSPAEWIPDQRRLQAIRELLASGLGHSSLLKQRQNGYGLQDEIYRIYAEHLAPHIYPTTRTKEILARLDLGEVERQYQVELQARQEQYRLLRDWADHHLEQKRKELAKIRLEEERDLEMRLSGLYRPEPENIAFRPLSQAEKDQRWKIHNDLVHWQLEKMHYSLLLDFENGFNDVYRRTADERTSEQDEDKDVQVQAEMRRLLENPYVMRFVPLRERESISRRGITPLQVLKWAADQEDVGRWLKRLVFIRRDYDRAIELADNVGVVAKALPEDTIGEINIKETWNHTLARGERICWREYARILIGEEIDNALANLEKIGVELRKLAEASVVTTVFPERGRWGEKGFKGHPAEMRLAYIISLTYNYQGYGRAVQHKFMAAVRNYGIATRYARQAKDESNMAYILNNQSRAESELGRRGRALRFCYDGLQLRRKKGVVSAIALSHSTLALIYNDQGRPDSAWRSAAKAIAYARRIQARRTEGLALRHLGEALRRLAAQELQRGKLEFVLPQPPDTYFPPAQKALELALKLFISSSAAGENPRLVDIRIELGCLHRDWLQVIDKEKSKIDWRIHLNNALGTLEQAANDAARMNLNLPYNDAKINRAWTYFRADQLIEAEQEIKLISPLLKPPLEKGGVLPSRTDREAVEFFQLSKLFHLLARIKMEQYRQLLFQMNEGAEVADAAESVADVYVQAILYAQLYSARSGLVSLVYDSLYEYLREFNEDEQRDFIYHAGLCWQAYQADDVELEKFGVNEFLLESFGFSLDHNSNNQVK